jgi:hypothetical protein
MPFGQQLLVHLRPEAVNQHNFHAHALNQGQILGQVLQFARSNGFTCNAHHKGFAAVHVNIRRHRAKPRYEGEVKDSGHELVNL